MQSKCKGKKAEIIEGGKKEKKRERERNGGIKDSWSELLVVAYQNFNLVFCSFLFSSK